MELKQTEPSTTQLKILSYGDHYPLCDWIKNPFLSLPRLRYYLLYNDLKEKTINAIFI